MTRIPAGERKHRLRIYRPSETRGARGGTVSTPVLLRRVRAARRDVGAGERFRGGQELATQQVVFTITYYSDITEKMTLRDSQETDWAIRGLAEVGFREDLELICERVTGGSV